MASADFTATSTAAPAWRRTGLALSGLAVLFLVMDAGGKLIAPEMMIANTPPLGLPASAGLYRLLGAILAVCTALYVWPRTAVLGAVLSTGFLGGAIAVNLRAEMPLFSNTLFGVYVGALMWAGILLRRPEVGLLLGIGSAEE
jgi:DoxX-like family